MQFGQIIKKIRYSCINIGDGNIQDFLEKKERISEEYASKKQQIFI